MLSVSTKPKITTPECRKSKPSGSLRNFRQSCVASLQNLVVLTFGHGVRMYDPVAMVQPRLESANTPNTNSGVNIERHKQISTPEVHEGSTLSAEYGRYHPGSALKSGTNQEPMSRVPRPGPKHRSEFGRLAWRSPNYCTGALALTEPCC